MSALVILFDCLFVCFARNRKLKLMRGYRALDSARMANRDECEMLKRIRLWVTH